MLECQMRQKFSRNICFAYKIFAWHVCRVTCCARQRRPRWQYVIAVCAYTHTLELQLRSLDNRSILMHVQPEQRVHAPASTSAKVLLTTTSSSMPAPHRAEMTVVYIETALERLVPDNVIDLGAGQDVSQCGRCWCSNRAVQGMICLTRPS